MSNMKLPAHLARRQSRGLAEAAVAGLGGNNPPHISIRQNRFWLVDAAGNERAASNPLQLDVVIADINPNVSKVYYEGAYDPTSEERVPPTCFSDNGVGPSSQAGSPQSKLCSNCPQNVWGSDTSKVTGKQTKACNDAKKLAVVLPSEDGSERMAFLLKVPPATLKHLRTYAQSVKGMAAGGRPVDLSELVTRVTFDPKTQGVLNFAPVGWIDEKTADLIDELIAAKATDMLVGRNDVPRTEGLPPPKPVQQIAQQPAPKPVQQATLPELPTFAEPLQQEAPPPATRKGRTKAKAEPAPSDPFDIPPFLRRDAEPQEEAENPAQFGMAEPEDPDDELAALVDKAFQLPT